MCGVLNINRTNEKSAIIIVKAAKEIANIVLMPATAMAVMLLLP